ncbi:MAG: dTDP-4-dehydrorhamnose 3,5-epimerase [Candidatus Micrarchaeaceae archaeon]
MPFQFLKTEIPDVIEIIPRNFPDERGFFFENYKKSDFLSIGINYEFPQDNTSFSRKNVVRGLHFQSPPHEQGKLVRAVTGSILDVAVDIRVGSPTYGKWVSRELNEENKKMLWIPPGFAHGFFAIKESLVHYKVTNEYNKDSEGGIIYNDTTLAIKWPAKELNVSEKDRLWPDFRSLKSPFLYGKW